MGQVCRIFRTVPGLGQAGLSFSHIGSIPSGLLGSADVTPRQRYYEPIRLLTRHARWLCLSTRRLRLSAGVRGLSVPGFVFWHAPSPLTPESRTTASTRCLVVRAGLALSDGLAALTGVTRLIRVRLTLRLAPSPSRGFACQIAPATRPRDYMANGSFQGKLLSVYETKQVSLTHQRARRRRERWVNAKAGLSFVGACWASYREARWCAVGTIFAHRKLGRRGFAREKWGWIFLFLGSGGLRESGPECASEDHW